MVAKKQARIKLISNDLEKINKFINNSKQIMEKLGLSLKGPIPLPTKKLKINVRKSPCGDGKSSFERHEMRIHKRIIEFGMDDRAFRQIVKISIPVGLNIELKLI